MKEPTIMEKSFDSNSDRITEYATLTVCKQSFCIDIGMIRETRRWSGVTVLPKSPDFVLGVMNLRGIVIPIFDLSKRLGFGTTEPSERHVVIITETEGKSFGLLVDTVQEIVSVKPESIHIPPAASSAQEDSVVSGLISRDDSMMRIIDISSISDSLANAL